MENPSGKSNGGDGVSDAGRTPPNRLFMLIALLVVFGLFILTSRSPSSDEIDYDFFLEQVEADNVHEVRYYENTLKGRFKERPEAPPKLDEKGEWKPQTDSNGDRIKVAERFNVDIPPDSATRGELSKLLEEHHVKRSYAPSNGSLTFYYMMLFAFPIAILVMMYLANRRREQMMGGNFLSGFSKSPAKRYEGAKQRITFADVAGLQGVKADLQEIVEYLKSPQKFQRLGGRVPKGVLLNGPPGTGKTLLARAVAGEAGVPFYSVNGSEFIQMFVGVGASRVRDLFRAAKEAGPAIIFIDEIDAVGRQRGAGLGGGHDEREQTLNQILSEMDGFSPVDSVIVLAATNRPDVLDPALLRPGRFDRHVTVGRPTHQGRVEIFNVHVRNVPLADDVDIESLAASTIGMTGADIRNLVNEAALWAARHDQKRVSMSDFDYARDKVLMGAKREEQLLDEEKEKTAYHEAGHTLAAWFLKGAERVRKVTIIPRGRSLGSTQILPQEDRMSISKSQLLDQLVMMLGGRAAEQLIYEETTVGAENDLERATATARRMVMHWGMSEKLGPVSYKLSDEDPFLGRELHQHRQFSERTMEEIDAEVAAILRNCETRAVELLGTHREQLENLTRALLGKEELNEDEIAELIGPSVHEERRKVIEARRAEMREALKLEQEAKAKAAAAAAKPDAENAPSGDASGDSGGSREADDAVEDTESAADRTPEESGAEASSKALEKSQGDETA
ncbi:MAG: ATP-dependent zinc metalloprotease FtsH [Planctomycetales bacterium]|nr:ATP-dependent zinc metalloprotease FtsH [Planctomycetales bacterium]